jgi:hypothetical protein
MHTALSALQNTRTGRQAVHSGLERVLKLIVPPQDCRRTSATFPDDTLSTWRTRQLATNPTWRRM